MQVGKDTEIGKAEHSKEFLAFVEKLEEVVPKLTIEDQLREMIAKATSETKEVDCSCQIQRERERERERGEREGREKGRRERGRKEKR